MENGNISEYLKYNVLMFKVTGIWINLMDLKNTSYKKIIYGAVTNLLFIMAPQVCHVIFMYKARNNVQAFADEFSVSLQSLMVVFKLYSLIRYFGIIHSLIISMDDEIYRPKSYYHRKMTKKIMGGWRNTYITYIFLEIGFCLTHLSSPLIDYILNGTRVLPLVDCYPFPIYVSPTYEFMFFYQSLLLNWLVTENMNVDTLITGLLSFVSLQCDILCDNLRNLKLEQGNDEEEQKKLHQKLVGCIKHFNKIDEFLKDVNFCFSWNIFEQFACSVITFCTCMFRLSLAEPMSKEFIAIIFYQGTCLLQVFLFCWTGSEVTAKSEEIIFAAYCCDWVNASKEFRKSLLNFTQRTVKPLKIGAVLFPVSLVMFGQIVKSSFSYFTVLNTINEM